MEIQARVWPGILKLRCLKAEITYISYLNIYLVEHTYIYMLCISIYHLIGRESVVFLYQAKKRHGDVGASAVGSAWCLSGAEGLTQLQWPRALAASCSEALEAWCRRIRLRNHVYTNTIYK